MTCRVCLDDCEEKLLCKCQGYGHVKCIREWIKTRLNRGDRFDDVFYCEICRVPCLAERFMCSWLHIRVMAIRIIMLAAVLVGGINVIIVLLPETSNVMLGLMVVTMFTMLFVILRVLDSHCIHALLCSDVVYLEV